MRARVLILLAIAATAGAACGVLFPRDNAPTAITTPVAELNVRADAYCALEDVAADPAGFVGTDCDLVLFNGLRTAGCPASRVDLTAAEEPDRPGEWNRDPARTCYAEGRTGSRFSHDMLVGFLVWAWRTGPAALPAVERLITYGAAHDWIICEAKDQATAVSRCNVSPGLKATLFEVRARLGGADAPERKGIQFWDPTASGFSAHLAVVHLLLRGLMLGGVTDPELAFLDLMAGREPHNALFAAVAKRFKTGDRDAEVKAVLEDARRFPADHLPDSTGRCTAYLWERSEADTTDWSPCVGEDAPPALETYPGIDLVFFRAVVADLLPVAAADAALARPDGWHPYRRNAE